MLDLKEPSLRTETLFSPAKFIERKCSVCGKRGGALGGRQTRGCLSWNLTNRGGRGPRKTKD